MRARRRQRRQPNRARAPLSPLPSKKVRCAVEKAPKQLSFDYIYLILPSASPFVSLCERQPQSAAWCYPCVCLPTCRSKPHTANAQYCTCTWIYRPTFPFEVGSSFLRPLHSFCIVGICSGVEGCLRLDSLCTTLQAPVRRTAGESPHTTRVAKDRISSD